MRICLNNVTVALGAKEHTTACSTIVFSKDATVGAVSAYTVEIRGASGHVKQLPPAAATLLCQRRAARRGDGFAHTLVADGGIVGASIKQHARAVLYEVRAAV